jgi:hypothetical protein
MQRPSAAKGFSLLLNSSSKRADSRTNGEPLLQPLSYTNLLRWQVGCAELSTIKPIERLAASIVNV